MKEEEEMPIELESVLEFLVQFIGDTIASWFRIVFDLVFTFLFRFARFCFIHMNQMWIHCLPEVVDKTTMIDGDRERRNLKSDR